jgi:tetratricopeptide (TPR) repeat protein
MKFKLIFFFLVLTLSLSARKPDDGEVFFNNKQYLKARPIYESLLKQRPNDALYNYRYARCCYELKDYETALVHFEMCGSKLPMRDLYLAESYHNTYRFEEAVTAYQACVGALKPDDSKLPEFQRKIKQAEAGARMLTKVDDIAIVDSAVVSKSEFLKFYKFSAELGSLKQEPLKLSSRRNVDKVKYTTQRQDRVYYSDSIHGHMNIFTSYKLLDTWSDAASISDVINTSANENYPFLLLDGVTLYFAADGENSLGGYDLFVTRFTPATNSYLPPENIGFPFNSPANDYMMVIDEQRKIGWFASDRYQPAGKVMIYTFVPNATKLIVRSEDKDYIRRMAQLKSYRKVISDKSELVTSEQHGVSGSEKQLEFVVNDSVVYTHSNQFKSENAARLLHELHTLAIDQKALYAELTDLRAKYATLETESDRKALVQSILELEQKNMQAEKQLTAKNTELRNNENIYLQQQHK